MATAAEPGKCFSCGSRICRFAQSQSHRQPGRVFRLGRGERINSCPEPRVRFWTLLSGTAAICHTLQDGRRQISGIERAGSTVGGPMGHDASPMWLEALEPTEICEVDLTPGFAALRNDPEFMQLMFEVVHTRLERNTRHLTTLGRLDSTERVTLFLAETAALAPDGGPVCLPLSREDIADYLGLNAETVSRVFSKLKKAALFRFLSPTTYEVPDPEALVRRLPVPVTAQPSVPLAPGRTTQPAQPDPDPAGCPVFRRSGTG